MTYSKAHKKRITRSIKHGLGGYRNCKSQKQRKDRQQIFAMFHRPPPLNYFGF